MATITEIARKVGVSHQVVSKVLNGGRSTVGASAETRRRITEVAREMGYRPDAAGRALRSRRFRSIGVLMGGLDQFHLPQRTLSSLSNTLAAADFTTTLVCTDELNSDHLRQNPLLKWKQVDVLIVGHVGGRDPSVLHAAEALGIPVIWLNDWDDEDCVTVDEAEAVSQLVQHLARFGHQKITYLGFNIGPALAPHVVQRLHGFDTACDRCGIEALRYVHRVVSREDRGEASAEWLSRPNRTSAVIVNSLTAAQALAQTAMQMGLRIPEDIAICSFDNGSAYNANVPAITCAIRPEEAFGRVAAEMALQRAKDSSQPVASRVLQFDMAIGGSTDPQRKPVHLSQSYEKETVT